jgi:hypothetical protein
MNLMEVLAILLGGKKPTLVPVPIKNNQEKS